MKDSILTTSYVKSSLVVSVGITFSLSHWLIKRQACFNTSCILGTCTPDWQCDALKHWRCQPDTKYGGLHRLLSGSAFGRSARWLRSATLLRYGTLYNCEDPGLRAGCHTVPVFTRSRFLRCTSHPSRARTIQQYIIVVHQFIYSLACALPTLLTVILGTYDMMLRDLSDKTT